MTPVATALRQAGLRIGEEHFARLVAEAAVRLAPAGADDPEAALSRHDAEALRCVGADLAARRPRESDHRAGTAAEFVALLAEARSVASAAAMLGVDPSRIRHRLAAGHLVGIKRGRGWVLPGWQFTADGSVLAGMSVIGPMLRELHPVVASAFMTTPQPELVVGRRVQTPRTWLAGGGDPAPVAALAAALSQQL